MVLIGGEPEVAEKARARILEHFPGLRIAATFDGYGEIEAKVRAIKELQPDIVICGMGGVRQESFLLRLRGQGWRGWGFTCGGYLNQLHDGMSYYPPWIDATNLRWAYRLVREPGRLWRRYLIDYSHFGLLLLAALASKHRSSKHRSSKHRYAQTNA
jgi:N-acetylglucosaminyldiphosphoundecaprenol N-acetyl-beta-D-mannosaminyltransferase